MDCLLQIHHFILIHRIRLAASKKSPDTFDMYTDSYESSDTSKLEANDCAKQVVTKKDCCIKEPTSNDLCVHVKPTDGISALPDVICDLEV